MNDHHFIKKKTTIIFERCLNFMLIMVQVKTTSETSKEDKDFFKFIVKNIITKDFLDFLKN